MKSNLNKDDLEEVLYSCGINAFTHPSNKSFDSWYEYRKKIAEELLDRCDIKFKKGVYQ
jgi:hypothetical protein